MDTVAVLMSVYNGSRFLNEQLDSVLNQKDVDVRLLVRDDGSKDQSRDIVMEWQKRFPGSVFLEEGVNKGFAESFSELVSLALKRWPDVKWFAFADQDDVWLQGKLNAGVEALKRKGEDCDDVPLGYASNAMVVEEDLTPRGLRWNPDSVRISRQKAMVQSYATGCTMVFNRKAAELYVSRRPSQLEVHDFLMYQICMFLGRFVWDPSSHILYRQHGFNQLGSRTFMQRMKGRFTKYTYLGRTLERQNRNFLNAYGDLLAESDRDLLRSFVDYRRSPFATLRLLFNRAVGYDGFERDFFYRLKILIHTV